MRAWRLIISRIPSARLMVTTAGKPSGTAAIARLTAIMNSSSGAAAFKDANAKDEAADDDTSPTEGLTELVKAFLQGCFFLFDRLQHGGDQPQLSEHAGADDHAFTAPIGNDCAHEGGVLAVTQARSRLPWTREAFFCTGTDSPVRAASSTRRLTGFDQAYICRDEIAGFQEHNISRHQAAGGHGDTVAIPQNLRFGSSHFLKRCQGFFCAGFPGRHPGWHLRPRWS